MNLEYDLKFEEMKKYIPFLENMITRLESTSTSSSNPRQAQLDKIRSLRDLLSNKKKRMKMENLLKCEQVLINLYAKVEQRDTLSGDQKMTDFSIDVPTKKERSDLEAVRNKLKTVVKQQNNGQDTLPEILGRSEVNDVHTSGTKEPALFQRRPNQLQNLVINDQEDIKSPPGSATKRNYTRVLVSPETSSRRWSPCDTTERPLFSRRSPRKSPRRYSPNYYKKERKRSKESLRQSRKQKGLNITLKVPQESLNSLNTKDILSRIINCSDGDVDIETLRELRKQIRNELKRTGAKDDISDLILNSYSKKKSESKDKEVEEGELSDSESEAIESIYGSLVIREPGQAKTLSDKNSQSRNIQICFVINSDDKPKSIVKEMSKTDVNSDFLELEMYQEGEIKPNSNAEHKNVAEPHMAVFENNTKETTEIEEVNQSGSDCLEPHRSINENVPIPTKEKETQEDDVKSTTVLPGDNALATPKDATQFKANFYKPLIETNNSEREEIININSSTDSMKTALPTVSLDDIDNNTTLKQTEKTIEIPLLNEHNIDDKLSENALSEIDILKALKNEILCEITVPGTETSTPPLHMPKVNKVVSAQEILPKKRISIEKYKEKSLTPKLNLDKLSLKDENIKKGSLKLTDKECERFFSVPKISFDEEDESLDEHDDYDIETSDVYADLAPESPDHDDCNNIDCVPPVIIPVDPVKTIPVSNKADVDMRTLPPLSSDNAKSSYNVGTLKNINISLNKMTAENNINQINSHLIAALADPRLRELKNISNQSPNPHAGNPERTPRHNIYANSSSSTPNPMMTPNARTYEMTPTYQPFEIDQSSRTHVYVPTLAYYDTREREKSVTKEVRFWECTDSTGDRRSHIDDVAEMSSWNPTREQLSQNKQNERQGIDNREDLYNRSDCPSFGRTDVPASSNLSFVRQDTPIPSFARSDCPNISNYPYGRLELPTTPSQGYGRLECPPTPTHIFGRLECPPTPIHSFGRTDGPHAPSHPLERTDCQPTPSHSFGRIDCPPTPSHPFGRTDCPPTPNHPFGRKDCPPTPNHPFGRTDCPSTPNHPFGRTDCPPTPNHPFGRTDCPPTPNHPFGRNEGPPPLMLNLIDGPTPNNSYADCPPTPSPIFGRNECPPTPSRTFSPSDSAEPNHPYGYLECPQTPNHLLSLRDSKKNHYNRPEFNPQLYNKDPRLNRKTDSESKPTFDDRDHSFYKDRDRFHGNSSKKLYSNSETYRNYDRELNDGRNNKYKYYAPEYRGRQYNKDINRERSMGRSLSKDKEKGAHSNRDCYDGRTRSYEEYGPRRDKSVGRTVSQEDTHSLVRTPNVSRNHPRETNHNKLSVTNADRSFVIDISTNSTFQKIIDTAKEIEGFVNNFDARRQRAASVGRSLARETTSDITSYPSLTSKSNKQEEKRDFRRASSVGREVNHNIDRRTFQEIKADFRTYKQSVKPLYTPEVLERSKSYKTKESECISRSRKDVFESQKNDKRIRESKNSYSPRRNYRDPRVRRQFDKRNDNYSLDGYHRRSGIVYSNDNIITGTILTSGYGVKNYKIPKIKRVTEEKEVAVENRDTTNKKDKKMNTDTISESNVIKGKGEPGNVVDEHNKQKAKDVSRQKISEVDIEENIKSQVVLEESNKQCDRRLTRSAKTTKRELKLGTAVNLIRTQSIKTKKCRKVINNSDTDSEMEKATLDNSEDSKSITDMEKDVHGKKSTEQWDSTDLNSNFGITELEIFNDNTISDSVMHNINALIADLDSDINTSKSDPNHYFPREINVENIVHDLKKDNKTICDDESAIILDAIDNISSNQVEICNATKIMSESCNNHPVKDKIVSQELISNPSSSEEPKLGRNELSDSKNSTEGGPTQSDAICQDENLKINKIISASLEKSNNDIDSTTENVNIVNEIEDKLTPNENADGCSTPDSTINTDDVIQTSNKDENLGNTHEVTSTETIETKPSSFLKETYPALNSIGSLLSYLDKSKIKELLNLLDDKSSENEKIKKRLEKLSEIVSDDDDTCDNLITKYKNVEESKMEQFPCKEVDEEETIQEKQVGNLNDQEPNESSTDVTECDSKLEKENSKLSDAQEEVQEDYTETTEGKNKTKKKTAKKAKNLRRFKGKIQQINRNTEKRITRANAPVNKPKVKKPPRELMKLHEDIKEMFIRDGVLGATGLRTCRLSKLCSTNTPSTTNTKDETALVDSRSTSGLESSENTKPEEGVKFKKKNMVAKIKIKALNDSAYECVKNDKTQESIKYKAGPKSKTKNIKDPYAFESDSIGETTNTDKASDSRNSSDIESDSIASANSFESFEHLSEIKKKPKRKRRSWQAGVIKSKTKKKRGDLKQLVPNTIEDLPTEKLSDPDINCFTDKKYCFRKNQLNYSCRLCSYDGSDIVLHYRNQHPHVEIPLSRMAPDVAKEAIEQCEEVNFKAISKTSSDKYVCIFCFQEFTNCKTVLETFFWHVVSTHTGEFKQYCSQCVNVNDCPFKLHIPPPPENTKKQLIGYICKKCNFTQLSLENLKTHVIVRHDDKQTAVYTINLSAMTKKALNSLLRRSNSGVVSQKDTRLSVSVLSETSDIDSVNESCNGDVERKEKPLLKSAGNTNISAASSIQSKITFEGDDNISELYDTVKEADEINIKTEKVHMEHIDETLMESRNEHYSTTDLSKFDMTSKLKDKIPSEQAKFTELQHCNEMPIQLPQNLEKQTCNDILDYPHFKIKLSESGGKEYFCCINGNNHFKTTLLISIKKHVQSKHFENWDGYCYVCKVIVTPQGVHKFGDCLQHYLDKHIDDFPILEKECVESSPPTSSGINTEVLNVASVVVSSTPKITVRPLSELTLGIRATPQENGDFPIIHSVTSLGTSPLEQRLSSPHPEHTQDELVQKISKYEEHQAEVLSKKYYLVVQTMMSPENLVKIFKCSGRFCSYTTDSAQEALAHATTHQRSEGSEALNCSYCDFNTAGNAVDLVTHVFKIHGCCRYCCQQCFYRAMTSQTVGAHMSRIHGAKPQPGSVLRTATISSISPLKYNMLTREQAVAYYICGHAEREVQCKFRTYTPDKFCEHLEQRHSASAHPCHVCSITFSKATELVHHMKDHGMMLYQCTWCVHGADNESDLLDHISSQHPDKTPQAYIRIITNKDRSSEQRVLPLAFLNKYKVSTIDIVPAVSKENPEREAKRSIELEALIGPFVTNSIETIETAIDVDNIDSDVIQTAEMSEDINETCVISKKPLNVQTSVTSMPPNDAQTCPVTPSSEDTEMAAVIRLPSPILIDSQERRPVERTVKVELVEPQKKSFSDIVSESEEEISTTAINDPVIVISDDEAPPISELENQRSIIPSETLHTCPKCKQVYKYMSGLRKHVFSCVTDVANIECPHCTHIAENLEKLLWHYLAVHTMSKTFQCQLCEKTFISGHNAKKHFRSVHKESKIIITPKEKNGVSYFSVIGIKKVESPKERVVPKRKLSGPKTDEISVKRKFDPEEIDQVPRNAIVNHLLYCSLCEFNTKVRLNLVRHLECHAKQQPVSQMAPINPVPHLETNEKHFDKMVNLASSSVMNRTPDKSRPEVVAQSVTMLIPPEVASCYPKYVPDRQRHTCGARGCSYISLDEAMLRRHWDTLHSETSDFRCVHCPPHQHLDTSKPLTAYRVISHLKMHDAPLYGCSMCSYYHYRRDALDKHLKEIHKDGRLVVVREQVNSADIPASTQVGTAPTMDLKPWQCGLCSFKSMLQPQVVNHCAKIHQSKMQFKCGYCPFRTSAIENVTKHQANSHAGKPEDIFYYFYREDSIPNEPDGTPRWKKQYEKFGQSVGPEIKMEVTCGTSPVPTITTLPVVTPISVDLNLVKKEKVDNTLIGTEKKNLCNVFGEFCDPNGIKFKCPLCSVIMEDTREGMQSHLYEELNYRKWSCGLCSYKAFHKVGLTDHMTSEHRRQYEHIELPSDVNIEKWVIGVLDHQENIINKHKNNLVKQKVIHTNSVLSMIPTTEAASSAQANTSPSVLGTPKEIASQYLEEVLEKAFGSFGHPKESMFSCPKCGFLTTNVGVMRDHLETELNKIRWLCSNCPQTYHTYHEAQFHCKGHDGPSRPIEAIRDPGMRAAWLTATINRQKSAIQSATATSSEPPTPEKNNPHSDNENSLLVVRYEKNVPTPDQVNMTRKRSAPDSDDEKLVIDEGNIKKKCLVHCPYCNYHCNNKQNLKTHVLIHFNLKHYSCGYCEFAGSTKNTVERHSRYVHSNLAVSVKCTVLPAHVQKILNANHLICLTCYKSVSQTELGVHTHNNAKPQFSTTSNVLRCNICLDLRADHESMVEHYKMSHTLDVPSYSPFEVCLDKRNYNCVYCASCFTNMEEFKSHHRAAHSYLKFQIGYEGTRSHENSPITSTVTPMRRCARKSTAKLPNSIAKKSTTKLPHNVPDSDEEYSYYGTKPLSHKELSNVTTSMSFCNSLVPFTMTQLREHLNIEPLVVLTDCKHSTSD